MSRTFVNAHVQGDKIAVVEYINDQKQKNLYDYCPTLYLNDPNGSMKTLYSDKVSPYSFNTIKQAREFKRKHDVEPVHGNDNFLHSYLSDYHHEYKIDVPAYNKFTIVYLDIETFSTQGFPNPEKAVEEINAITVLIDRPQGTGIITFGLKDYDKSEGEIYIKCANESELLTKFITMWRKLDPDIVTGWNIKMFDIPYLINRINKLGLDVKQFTPWNKKPSQKKDIQWGQEFNYYYIHGLNILDYYEVYRKFTIKNQESYKLDYISSVELDEKKIDYSEYMDLDELWEKNHQKFIEYNIKDVLLVKRIDKKLQLINLVLLLASQSKVNMEDTFSQISMWHSIIANYLSEQGLVVPAKKTFHKSHQYEGAWVKDPQIGHHNWIMSFDLTSLYPMLMRQYNISPETFSGFNEVTIDQLLNKQVPDIPADMSLSGSGAMYSNKKEGILPAILKSMFETRKEAKQQQIEYEKKMVDDPDNTEYKERAASFKNLQSALKVCLNSCYGAIGSDYFRYYSYEQAESVTISGQLSIRWVENEVNNYMNSLLGTDKDYIIASDTDSLYIRFDELVKKVFGDISYSDVENKQKIIKFLKKVSDDKIVPLFDKAYEELFKQQNAYINTMSMKREIIADVGIFRKKKNYILSVWDSEGVEYTEPKIEKKGMESIRSSTPYFCRGKLNGIYGLIMQMDEKKVQKYVEDTKNEFEKASIEDISFPSSCNEYTKYVNVTKSVPIHVRAAKNYNKMLDFLNISAKNPKITNGDKIKYIYLNVPNKLTGNENVMAYIGYPPLEFHLKSHVDYKIQFEKAFLSPVKSITKLLGWNIESESYATLF